MFRLLPLPVLLWCASVIAQPVPRYGVVISEILADPSPPAGLPAAEFIEIRNTLPFAVSLDRWQLGTGRNSVRFPAGTLLEADSFLVICARSQEQAFAAFGKTIGISGFPALGNDGDTLALRDAAGAVVHAVGYSATWYGGNWKGNGGWSLELIDHRRPCLGAANWAASIDPAGGTPGRKNSIEGIRPDSLPPLLLRTYMRDSITLTAVYSESLDSLSAADAALYALTGGIGRPMQAIVRSPLFHEVDLLLPRAPTTGAEYLLKALSPPDCAGNRYPAAQEAKAGRPFPPAPGMIRINEILFNPVPGGSDYVELYHRGSSPVDLSALYLANRNQQGLVTSLLPCAEAHWFLYPGEYVVLTADTSSVNRDYNVESPSQLKELGQFPTFSDDAGTVVITDNRGTVVDQFSYTDKMHYALLSNKEGVSLERIDPEAQATRWAVAPLSRVLACEWIESGVAEQRLAWQIEELQQRWRLAARVLGPRIPQGRAAAPHLWLDSAPPAGLAEACRQHGVEVVPAEVFAIEANPGHAARVSLAAAASRAELKRALEGIVAAWPLA